MSEVVGRVLAVDHDERLVVSDPTAKYFGVHIGERTLVPHGEHPFIGAISLDDWLVRSRVQAA